jgi:hypothetical protein
MLACHDEVILHESFPPGAVDAHKIYTSGARISHEDKIVRLLAIGKASRAWAKGTNKAPDPFKERTKLGF